MPWRVGPMEERDLAALAAIERLCFSLPWSEAGLGAELGNPAALFLTARRGEEPAGYIGVHICAEEAEVANLAVHPAFRRQGLGRMLVLEACRLARARGARRMTLEARASNSGALALYEGCGFVRLGVRRGLYERPREDGIVLARTLAGRPGAEREET